jgi:phage gpG-like protein
MKAGMAVLTDRTREVLTGMRELAATKVMVGVPEDKNERTGGEPGQPVNNAALGFIHEFGAPEANIPARPFLIPGLRKSRDQWLPRMREAAKAAMEGKPASVTANLSAAGTTAQSAVRAFITAGQGFAPLAAATLAARRRKGRTGTKPLIDTGQLRRAITYVLRRK